MEPDNRVHDETDNPVLEQGGAQAGTGRRDRCSARHVKDCSKLDPKTSVKVWLDVLLLFSIS